MTISSELTELLSLRLKKSYQAAEQTRRRLGAAAMAKYPPASSEFGDLRLMVNVWETIANRVHENKSLRVPFFQTSPVGYMWSKLSPGIKILQKGHFKGRGGKFYAKQFQTLNTSYSRWLGQQAPQYRTAAKAGIGAQFG
jgi:hypothetical protein